MIYDYLLKYGFKPNNIGLNYLADIINLGIKGENLEPLSRVGYKLIADKYKKNIATIEKDIQNSISNAWLYGNSDLLYQTFGSTISDVKGKPTNKKLGNRQRRWRASTCHGERPTKLQPPQCSAA